MRVAHLVGVFPRLSETFILNQLTGLLERGVEVDIFSMARGDLSTLHPSVHRYRLLERDRYWHPAANRVQRTWHAGQALLAPASWHPGVFATLDPRRYGKRALNLEMLYTALSFRRQAPYDILHAQFGGLGLVGLELRQLGLFSGKLLTSFRGADLTRSLRKQPGMYRALFQQGDLFLPVSEYFEQRLIEEGCSPQNIALFRSGIDTRSFAFKIRHRAEDEVTRLLFIGRLEEKKGVLVAAQAVAQALCTGRKLEFHVVGDGTQRSALEALVAQHGIGHQVRLYGQQPHERVLEHLARAHLLIAPSMTSSSGDQEGIPNTIKEGMAVGLPVLSTRHTGIPELVEEGVSGYLVEEHDVQALTECLLHLVDHPERWEAMGRAGRAKIEREYDNEVLSDQLIRLYEQVLSAS